MNQDQMFSNYISSLQNWEQVTFDEKVGENQNEFFTASYGELGQNIFVKKIDLSKDETNEFQTEVKALLSLNHNNIVNLLQYGVQNGNDQAQQFGYIILPNFGKCNLGDLLFKKYRWIINENDLNSFAFNLLSAINHIHSNGIIHRDLKPENIAINVFATNDETKTFTFLPDDFSIIDFGSSYIVIDHLNDEDDQKLSDKLNFRKTLEYAPPEFINYLEMTEKYDIYSAGVILFYLVTGHYPMIEFSIDNNSLTYLPYESIDNLFDQQEWSSISVEMQNIIKSMLSFDPLMRPSANALLKSDIFSCQIAFPSGNDDDHDYW